MRKPRSSADETESLITIALEQGWSVELKKGGHLCFKPPDKTQRAVYTASTPSDRRGPKNLRCDLRRSGLIV